LLFDVFALSLPLLIASGFYKYRAPMHTQHELIIHLLFTRVACRGGLGFDSAALVGGAETCVRSIASHRFASCFRFEQTSDYLWPRH
jgi:hypothetical protein